MEVQNHGVVFEDYVVKSITGLNKKDYQSLLENAYTASMDIKKDIHSDCDYSIKVSKNGASIGCGDILRFNQHCRDGQFTMIVGAWKQNTVKTKIYYEIYEFDITPGDYKKLWSGITHKVLKPFVSYVKSIPQGKTAQKTHQNLWKEKRNKIYETYGKGLVTIDAKIDSKNQRRVQCSVKIKELIEAGISYRKYCNIYRDLSLPIKQNSGPRQFNG